MSSYINDFCMILQTFFQFLCLSFYLYVHMLVWLSIYKSSFFGNCFAIWTAFVLFVQSILKESFCLRVTYISVSLARAVMDVFYALYNSELFDGFCSAGKFVRQSVRIWIKGIHLMPLIKRNVGDSDHGTYITW